MRKTRLLAWLVVGACAIPWTVSAQIHRGSIRGIAMDALGGRIADALVRALNEATSEARETRTDDAGGFAFAALAPGSYRVELQAPGHRTHVERVALSVNQEVRIDATLEVGSISEEIVVEAPMPFVQRESMAISTVIENCQITNLPLDGRNFLELALLVPGTAPGAPGSAGSIRGEFSLVANGAREDANTYLLDGAYNMDPKLNTVAVRPPVDAIEEFAVVSHTYDAAFGRNAGAQLNVVLKSGTNVPHGAAYEFFRDGSFDARNFFAPRDEPAPEYSRHQFGGALGGPITKGRTFFFADYEGTRIREGITRVTNVPTARERSGDFSQSVLPPPQIPFTGVPFPGTTLPPALVHPIGRAIAALYPLPNRADPLRNFVSSPVQRDRSHQFDVRLDHVIGTNGGLTARYSFADRDLFEPFAGPTFAAIPGFGNEVPRRGQNLSFAETHVLSPDLVSEARFAFGRVSTGVFQENQGVSLNRLVGLPDVSQNPRDLGLSFITITGYSPLGHEINNPQQGTINTLQFFDNVTWTRGRHLLKIGGDFRTLRQDAFRDVQSRGFLNFSSQAPFTGNALADLLLGLPVVTGAARLDNPQRLRAETVNLYVHDSLRVSPNLTVSAGLRYEVASPPVDPDDRASVYDPATRSLVQVGTNGVPRSGYDSDRNNLAPRLGVVWSADDEGRTVVRGAYGIYYDQSALAPGEALYFTPPYFNFNLYLPLAGLPLTLEDPFPASYPVELPDSALAFQRDLATPFLHHFNVNVQRQLGTRSTVDVAYVGSRGRRLIAARDMNQPAPSPAPVNFRPVPQFDDITLIESRASSSYNALQLGFQQRLDRGLSVIAAYTLGKSTDDASGFFASAGDANFPQDSNNVAAEKSRSSFDVRHRLTAGFSYDLPFRDAGNGGWVNGLLSDWEIHGLVTLQSGRPFTVALLPDIDNSNTGRSVLGFGANDRPNLVGDPDLDDPGADFWFNPAAFAFPAFGTFGNAGRNILEGPGYANVNLGVIKHLPVGNRYRVQLRAEAFNLFNRVNLNLPDNFLGSPTFGQTLSAGSPRHLQFGVKLLF
jgi:hypothetical protein